MYNVHTKSILYSILILLQMPVWMVGISAGIRRYVRDQEHAIAPELMVGSHQSYRNHKARRSARSW